MLKWPYFSLQKVGILRCLITDNQVSCLCKFPENVSQSWNIEVLLVDGFTDEKKNSNVILSPREKWAWINSWSLKFITRRAFFWRMINLLAVIVFWAQTIHD